MNAPFLAMPVVVFALAPCLLAQRNEWKRQVLNAASNFEAAGIADFDKDGHADVMCGDTWYSGPDFAPHKVCDIAAVGDAAKGGYRIDFANLPLDVDGDGLFDV